MSPSRETSPRARGAWLDAARLRRIRLYSGLVLFCFVATHLLNHALGLISLQTMLDGRRLFIALWDNLVGSALLLAAGLAHLSLALWSIYQRRQLRMPLWQGLQLGLGLLIPTVLVNHLVFTSGASSLHDYRDSYTVLMLVYWQLRPDLGLWQAVLVLLTWTHACIGIHYWLRMHRWYPSVAMALYTAAIMVPLLALLGFAQAGRYASVQARDPGWLGKLLQDAQVTDAAAMASLTDLRNGTWAVLAALLGLTLGARALRQWREASRSVRIHYPNARVVSVPRGFTVLESSRLGGIAHASVCGGRGRCSTCRVRVHASAASLPAPDEAEARVLARVGAGENVRLACQLRPMADLRVTPLIPPSVPPAMALSEGELMAGQERELCVLFADLRGFTRLSEQRLPYDVVFLLNRYFEAVGDAIEGAGGVANQFTGDGVMALFGIDAPIETGARQALQAARAMQLALRRLSADLHEELHSPLRIGIGIHSGPCVVGHMGRGVATYLTAVGDTVNTASRLQDQTKAFDCELVVSTRVAAQAGLDTTGMRHEQVALRNRAQAVEVVVVPSVEARLAPDPAA